MKTSNPIEPPIDAPDNTNSSHARASNRSPRLSSALRCIPFGGVPLPDPATATTLQRTRLLGVEQGRIRRLTGFLKGAHFEPENHTAAANAFVRKIGHAEVEERAESLFRELREAFRYKRKDLTYTCDHGNASLQTPTFAVDLLIDQAPEEAREFALHLTIRDIRDPEVLTSEPFLHVFRRYCHTIEIEFSEAIDLEAQIDHLEASDHLAPLLDYSPDVTSLTIRLPNPSVHLELTPHCVRFSIPRGGDLHHLITGTLSLFDSFAAAGSDLFRGALPLAR